MGQRGRRQHLPSRGREEEVDRSSTGEPQGSIILSVSGADVRRTDHIAFEEVPRDLKCDIEKRWANSQRRSTSSKKFETRGGHFRLLWTQQRPRARGNEK